MLPLIFSLLLALNAMSDPGENCIILMDQEGQLYETCEDNSGGVVLDPPAQPGPTPVPVD